MAFLISLPSPPAIRSFTSGACLPNEGPRAFITGSAFHETRSYMPATARTDFALARSQYRVFKFTTESSTCFESVATVHSDTGQRTFFSRPAGRLPGLRRTTGRCPLQPRAVCRQGPDLPAYQGSIWTLSGSPPSLMFLYITSVICGMKGARRTTRRRIT